MKSQTFIGKVGQEALKLMNDHINHWLETHQIEPREIHQVFGYEQQHQHDGQEPVLITTIWY